jgi:hypothetical protein
MPSLRSSFLALIFDKSTAEIYTSRWNDTTPHTEYSRKKADWRKIAIALRMVRPRDFERNGLFAPDIRKQDCFSQA